MKIGTREALIIVAIIVVAAALLDPNLALRFLGSIQSISITILAWVAIVYLLKRM